MTETATASPPAPQADPLAGTAYRALRRIGTGAMGQVFEAEHVGLRRKVAVKVLSPALAGDPVFADRLRLEAQALASVRHPNVVLIHDYATTPAGAPFLAMELLEGRTLHELWRQRGMLPVPEALRLMEQICAGLSAIHAAGLTHRDLKPANVFLCEEGGRAIVKLLDFGIVKIHRDGGPVAPLHHPTEQGHVVGTPRFMAPEQVRGQRCDARTDVYAAGVLLYMLLAGRDPFHHHRGDVAILTAQVMEPPPPLSKVAPQAIPPGVEAAIARALAKEPDRRFPSMEAFAAALSAASSDTGAVVVPSVTEKIDARMWNAPPPSTAPIDNAVFRAARPALPFVVVSTKAPPSFGLPPVAPAKEVAAKPARAVVPCAPAAPKAAIERAWWMEPWMEDWRVCLALVVFLWCLVALVAWRAL